MKIAQIFSWISFSFKQHKFRNSFCHKYIWNQWGSYGKAGGGGDVYLFVPSDKVSLLRATTYLSMDVDMLLNVLIFLYWLRIYKNHCSLFNLYFGDCSHPILLLWRKRGSVWDHYAISPSDKFLNQLVYCLTLCKFYLDVTSLRGTPASYVLSSWSHIWQNGGSTNLSVRAILAPRDLAVLNFMWLDWDSVNGVQLCYVKFCRMSNNEWQPHESYRSACRQQQLMNCSS